MPLTVMESYCPMLACWAGVRVPAPTPRRAPSRLGSSSLGTSLLLAALCALPSDARSMSDEGLFFSELPIIASVSRLPQRLEDASASVTVIDRALIKASGARDLNDIFRLVPGFQTFPNNTDAARVTYHGMTDNDFSPRVQVLIDGRSQYSPLFRNGVNWATLPVALEDIERIEVVRGSNAVSYGSNAFLGVINIITVDPALAHGVSVGVNRGNQGVRDTTLRAGGRLGEAGDFRFTYQAKDDDGLEDQFDWQDSLRSRMFNLRTDFWLSQRDQLQFSIGHVEARTTLGRLAKSGDVLTGGFAPGNPIRDFDQSDSYLQLQWYRALDDSSDFRLRYAYTEDRGSEQHIERRSRRGVSWAGETNLLYELDAFGDVGTRHEVEGQHAFSPLQAVRMVWGAGWIPCVRKPTFATRARYIGASGVCSAIWNGSRSSGSPATLGPLPSTTRSPVATLRRARVPASI